LAETGIGENGKVLGIKVYLGRRVTSVVDRPNNIILFIKLNIPIYTTVKDSMVAQRI